MSSPALVPAILAVTLALLPLRAAAQTDPTVSPAPSRTLRAVRLTAPLALDGRLDEAVYASVPPTGGFTQQEPNEGEPATEETDVWVFYDDTNIYVSARCWDSEPLREIANEMRRDGNLMQNDNLVVTLDTFHDRRTGFYFQTNPVGGLRDQQINSERSANLDWNAVWDARSARDEDGWTTEMTIPFKSLRYPAGLRQVWGINFRRMVRWKNEISYFSPVPSSFGGRGIFVVALAGTLAKLEVPASSPTLEIKPYATAAMDTDRRANPPLANDPRVDAGLDVKYGITKGLTADLTVNTDFAQVEADEAQVNLTRATLFFPEKRDFFLEGQGIFGFGGAPQGTPGRSGLGPLLGGGGAPSLIPSLFFSRRIGLSNGRVVPIRVGARLAGRTGLYSVGVLNIQTAESAEASQPATNFSVVRVRRDILGRSSLGAIVTSRAPRLDGAGSNQTFGVDTSLVLSDAVTVTSYYAGSRTPGITDDDRSYLGKVDAISDRYGLNVEHLSVGEGFKPDIGLVRREAFRRTYGHFRFSPRPQSIRAVRKLWFDVSLDYLTDRRGRLQSRQGLASFRIDLNNGDQFNVNYHRDHEFLESPLVVGPGVHIAPGAYSFQGVSALYYIGPQRWLSGRVSAGHGSFYGGYKTEATLTSRLDLGAMLGVEPRVQIDWVTLPHTRFTSTLVGGRVSFTMTPRLSVASLLQYNSNTDSLASNVRLRWEYIPGSDLYVVYTDNRDTTQSGFPELDNRSFVVKVTRMLRR
jgi:hypothetical protein